MIHLKIHIIFRQKQNPSTQIIQKKEKEEEVDYFSRLIRI